MSTQMVAIEHAAISQSGEFAHPEKKLKCSGNSADTPIRGDCGLSKCLNKI